MKDKEGKKSQPETEKQKAEKFLEEYQALCKKHSYRIVVNPAFQARDDGTWSVVLQTSVGRLPKEMV